jgi:hypothetical protein
MAGIYCTNQAVTFFEFQKRKYPLSIMYVRSAWGRNTGNEEYVKRTIIDLALPRYLTVGKQNEYIWVG